MNRLIIIGNGFDLAHGLKTSYADFMLGYLKSAIQKAEYPKVYEDGLIRVRQENPVRYSDPNWLEKQQSISDLIAKAESCYFKIERLTSFSKTLLNHVKRSNWVDIEAIYYEHLIDALNASPSVRTKRIEPLNDNIQLLKSKLLEYLEQVEAEYVYDQNHEAVEVYSDFLRGAYGYETLIVNFNYTSTVRKYLDHMGIDHDREIRIHGSIDDEDSIVFGFGDELDKKYQEIEELNDNRFFQHIKSFKYLENDAYQKLMKFVKRHSIEVHVLGHSLGLSDRTMLSQIFESENLLDVNLYYYEKPDGTNDFTEKTHEISRHFKDKARMRLKIIPFSECQPMPQIPPK